MHVVSMSKAALCRLVSVFALRLQVVRMLSCTVHA